MGDNEITGTIPTEIGQCKKLEQLCGVHFFLWLFLLFIIFVFSGIGLNSLTGTIPTEIGALTRLTLMYNSFFLFFSLFFFSLSADAFTLSTTCLNNGYWLRLPIPSLQPRNTHTTHTVSPPRHPANVRWVGGLDLWRRGMSNTTIWRVDWRSNDHSSSPPWLHTHSGNSHSSYPISYSLFLKFFLKF